MGGGVDVGLNEGLTCFAVERSTRRNEIEVPKSILRGLMADDSEWDDLSGDGGVLKKLTAAPAGDMFLPTHDRT